MADIIKNHRRFEVIEIDLEAGVLEYNLNYQSLLSRREINGIAIEPGGKLSLSKGRTLVDPLNAYFILKSDENTEFAILPCSLLQYTPGSPLLNFLNIDFKNVDWEKSVLKFAPGTSVSANTAFQMVVSYQYA